MRAGFSVTGTAKEGSLMSKGGMQAGQAIILTKPLGTGTIMAAAMRRRAKGRWITGLLFDSYSFGRLQVCCEHQDHNADDPSVCNIMTHANAMRPTCFLSHAHHLHTLSHCYCPTTALSASSTNVESVVQW